MKLKPWRFSAILRLTSFPCFSIIIFWFLERKNIITLWEELFFWRMDIYLINSYILYRSVKKQKNERPLNHLRFIKNLVDQLRGDFRQPRDRASMSTANCNEIWLNGQFHVILIGTKRDCKMYSCRNKVGKRHETIYYCDTCPDKDADIL